MTNGMLKLNAALDGYRNGDRPLPDYAELAEIADSDHDGHARLNQASQAPHPVKRILTQADRAAIESKLIQYGVRRNDTASEILHEIERAILDRLPTIQDTGPTLAPRGSQIKATLHHDAGAYAQCQYCARYSDSPHSLTTEDFRCDCGQTKGWCGSFKKPTHESRWSGPDPRTADLVNTINMAMSAAIAREMRQGGLLWRLERSAR